LARRLPSRFAGDALAFDRLFEMRFFRVFGDAARLVGLFLPFAGALFALTDFNAFLASVWVRVDTSITAISG